MADHLDYNEPATLLIYDADAVRPGQTRTTTLDDAVRTIVEEWKGVQLIDVYIATPSGPIEGIDAVMAIYDRADFPASSDNDE